MITICNTICLTLVIAFCIQYIASLVPTHDKNSGGPPRPSAVKRESNKYSVLLSYSPAPAARAFRAMAHSRRLRSSSQPTLWGCSMSPLTSRLEAEQPPEQ